MAHVIGNSADAFKFAKIVSKTKQAIEENLSKIEKYSKEMHNVWKNANSSMIDEMIEGLRKAIKDAESDFAAVENGICAYAEYLESIGS